MRELEIALGVICQGDRYLLQLRGDDPNIGAAGRIGAFGGKVEPGETAAEAACRELTEETTLTPLVEELKHIGKAIVVSDHRHEDVKVHATIFCIVIDEKAKVAAREGKLVTLTRHGAMKQIDQLTPATRACFEQLMTEKD